MGLLHEDRLDRTVDAGSIGIGETVEIRSKMGRQLAIGEVVATNPMGLALSNGQWYDRDIYLFAPIEESPPVVLKNTLNDGPDARSADKLKSLGLSFSVQEADKLDDGETGKDSGSVDPGKAGGVPVAKPDSSVDVDSLPADIQKAIVSTTQMDSAQLNGVMSEIGDSVVKALKRASVKDTEIYGTAAKIQNSIFSILTGRSPDSPEPSGKKVKK